MHSFFFHELQLITVLLSKTVRGIFHFRFLFVLLKYTFLFYKMHGLLDFKTS